MKIEEGKYYRTRRGDVVGPARSIPSFVDYPWSLPPGGTYRENGKNTFAYGEHATDLVEEVSPPANSGGQI